MIISDINKGGDNVVNHINGIKHDNRVENLEWVTRKENINHYLLKDKKSKHTKNKKNVE